MLETAEKMQSFLARGTDRVLAWETDSAQRRIRECDLFLRVASYTQEDKGLEPIKQWRQRYINAIKQAKDNYTKARQLVNLLEDPVKTIVWLRDIERKTWLDIGADVGYCRRQTARLYKNGIEEILKRQNEVLATNS